MSPSVIRVSAPGGLGAIVPGPSVAGDAAAIVDLVFDYTEPYARAAGESQRTVRFTMTGPIDAATFAEAFRCEGVEDVAIDGRDVVVRLAADAAAEYARRGWCGVDRGPFYVASEIAGEQVTLRRRSGEGFDQVEVVSVPRAEAWRRLMARNINLVPRIDASARAEVTGLRGVRSIDLEAQPFGLFFNASTTSVEARRYLAGLLQLDALSEVVFGSSEWAAPQPPHAAAAEIPSTLTLIVLSGDSSPERAAQVIRHQLSRAGLRVVIEDEPLERFLHRLAAGAFDLAISPMPEPPAQYALFLSPEHPRSISISHYRSGAYDEAFDRSDAEAMEAILQRDLPALTLYRLRDFAVIDAMLCGDVQPSTSSWRWIADLHPCEP